MKKNILIVFAVIAITAIISFLVFHQMNKNKELKALETQIETLEHKVQSLFTSAAFITRN